MEYKNCENLISTGWKKVLFRSLLLLPLSFLLAKKENTISPSYLNPDISSHTPESDI